MRSQNAHSATIAGRTDTGKYTDQKPSERQQTQRNHPGYCKCDTGRKEPEHRGQQAALNQLAQAGDEEAAKCCDDIAGAALTCLHVFLALLNGGIGSFPIIGEMNTINQALSCLFRVPTCNFL